MSYCDVPSVFLYVLLVLSCVVMYLSYSSSFYYSFSCCVLCCFLFRSVLVGVCLCCVACVVFVFSV